jgi:hypothetical protein
MAIVLSQVFFNHLPEISKFKPKKCCLLRMILNFLPLPGLGVQVRGQRIVWRVGTHVQHAARRHHPGGVRGLVVGHGQTNLQTHPPQVSLPQAQDVRDPHRVRPHAGQYGTPSEQDRFYPYLCLKIQIFGRKS